MNIRTLDPTIADLAERNGYDPYYDMGGNGLLKDMGNAEFLISQITAEGQDDYEIPTDPDALMAWSVRFQDEIHEYYGYAQGLLKAMEICQTRYEKALRRK